MKSVKQMLAIFALTSLLATGALAGDTPCGAKGDNKTKTGSTASGTSDLQSYVNSMLGYASLFVFRF